MMAYRTTTDIKINNLDEQILDETTRILQHNISSGVNGNSMQHSLNSKVYYCCYWTMILGLSGSIIGATSWCLIHYYT